MIVPAAIGLVSVAIFLVVAAFNALVLLGRRPDGSGPSAVPVFGGIAGAIGVWVWPYHDLAAWAWLPLVLDPGCGWYVAGGGFLAARRAWRFRAGNCCARLIGDTGEKTVEIRLYRGGRCRIGQTFHEPRALGSFEAAGGWTVPGSGCGYVIDVWGASITLKQEGEESESWTVVRESGWFREELTLGPIRLTAE